MFKERFEWAREMNTQNFRYRAHLGLVMTTSTNGLS
jgi:hypothetical protein